MEIMASKLIFVSTLLLIIFSFQIVHARSCSDSDELDYYTAGYVDFDDSRYYDECAGDVLIEGYCDGDKLNTMTYYCPNGCEGGTCKLVRSISPECVWPEQKCVGNDVYQCNNLGEWEYFDTCRSGFFCVMGSPTSIYTVCKKPRALEPPTTITTCVSDEDCDDGNECTIDTCIYPATPSATCVYSNILAGTQCGVFRDCPSDQCNGYKVVFYPPDGHDYCDGNGNCIPYSCTMIDSYCTDNNPDDGVDGLTCGAECDQDSDCDTGKCGSDCICEISQPGCGNGVCDIKETYSNCPQDCCDSDCTATYDSTCHSECDPYCGIVDTQCNGKTINSCGDTEGICNGCEYRDCGNEGCECCYSIDGANCGTRYVDYICEKGFCEESLGCHDCGPYNCSDGECTEICSQACGAECDQDSDCASGVCSSDCICEPSQTCEDSDGGINYEVYGVCRDSSGSHFDVCDGMYYLKEYFCTNQNVCTFNYVDCRIVVREDYVCGYGECVYAPTTTTIRVGGCPILKAWDGKEFVKIEKLDIHAPEGIDTEVQTSFKMKPINGQYKIKLSEMWYALLEGSHIDSVRLMDKTGKECELVSAIHSKQGDVLLAIAESDDLRVDTSPGEEIELTFTECSGEEFEFTIEGNNPRIPAVKLAFTSTGILVIIAVVIILIIIIFGVFKIFTKHRITL